MKDADDIISGFDCNCGGGNVPYVVDFAAARLLDRSGSTCDAYECTIQRRRVFVKRLKAEYRDNPLYRAAFSKEYDLGVSLSHPSLPRYVGFGDDYIVTDYIEGDTLADLMKRGDRRLQNKRFVRKLLTELIDVVDYLHSRNIVHCDIKADNIIISPYRDRPATLIDLDKARSPWLDSTHGNTAKYGCEGCADGAIDFKAIGLIADKLGFKRFATACRKDDVSSEYLLKALRTRDRSTIKAIIWTTAIVLIGAAIVMVFDRNPAPVTINEPVQKVPTSRVLPVDTSTETPSTKTPVELPAESPIINPDTLDFEAIVKRHYGPLAKRHAYLRELVTDTMTSARQLRIAITAYAEDQLRAQEEIFSDAMELYGFSSPWDVQPMLGISHGWSAFMKADAELNALYSREISARGTKESRHRSDRPVSQPDTTPDVPLSAPHH